MGVMDNAGDRSSPSGPPAGPSGPPRRTPGPSGLRAWLPALLSLGAVVVLLIVTLVVLSDDGSDSARTTQPATSAPPTTAPDNTTVPTSPSPDTAALEAEAPAPTLTTAVPTPTEPAPSSTAPPPTTPAPATTAPPPTVDRALEFVDVAYNVDALPAGVVGHGGGALTGDLLYWIAHTEDAQGEMLWLETPLVETAEGITDWLVLDAVRVPAPGLLTGDLAGLWGVPCRVDGELDEEVVAVFVWSLNDPLVDPVVAWRASRQTLRFEPITGVVECTNEGAGV